MFEKAARMKLRFESPKGALTAEDLWDLPLAASAGRASLNEVAKGISRMLKETGEEDFVHKVSKSDEVLALKLDIVKHVIAVRVAENEAAAQASARKEQKEKLLELIAKKQDQQLEGKSLDELMAMAQEL